MQKIEDSSQPSQKQTHWFKIAEYASVIASTVGSVAVAAWYRQMLLASLPISLALWFNLINRQRFEQQIQQYTESAITDVQSVVQSLHEQVQTLPSESSELDPITDVLTELQRVTQSLENDVVRHQDWEMMNVRFKLIEEAIEQVQNTVKTQPKSLTSTEELIEINPQPSSEQTAISTEVALLYQQVMELDRQNREIVKPYLKRLLEAVKNLQKT